MTTNLGSRNPSAAKRDEIPLVRKVICPHCWRVFRPEEVLWVAEHEELVGDPIVKDEPIRFLPTRFTLDGSAIDAKDMVCRTLACPECHLIIARVLLENPVTFFSIIGSVGSGKSNFMATMTWELRRVLARQFAVAFSDADKESNWVLNRYEELLFLPDDPERPALLEKTRTQGDLYRSVRLNEQEVQVPKPFLFSMHPAAGHPWEKFRRQAGNIVCLYDNAGEHYGVGQDTALTPVTRHLSAAKVLMFLFDPTQDPRLSREVPAVLTGSADRRTAAHQPAGKYAERSGAACPQTPGFIGLPAAFGTAAGAGGKIGCMGAAAGGRHHRRTGARAAAGVEAGIGRS